MDKEINIVEILKDAPKGTKLWSPICGECILVLIDEKETFPIRCKAIDFVNNYSTIYFTSKGKYTITFNGGECTLFPSKENHDWSTFKVPEQHKHFEPFQKVLRIDDNNLGCKVWASDFYSHYDETSGIHFLTSGFLKNDDDIIPYESNEDKLGKTVEE